MSSRAAYFVAATIVTSGPISARIRSRFARTASGDTGDHPLDAARLARSPVREEELGIAEGAEVAAHRHLDALGLERALGRRPKVELPTVDDVVSERGRERLRDLGADVVAARADRRADRG